MLLAKFHAGTIKSLSDFQRPLLEQQVNYLSLAFFFCLRGGAFTAFSRMIFLPQGCVVLRPFCPAVGDLALSTKFLGGQLEDVNSWN